MPLKVRLMTSPALRFVLVLATSAALIIPLVPATSADASIKAKHYTSCKKLNQAYPHGVGRKGAKDHHSKSSKAVTNFKVSTKVFKMNNGARNQATGEYDLDRDNDGIACEKR